MKLLYCEFCGDVFKLDYEVKTCKCGRCSGYYKEDGLHAVIKGGIPLGIANNSLMMALDREDALQREIETLEERATGKFMHGERFEAFVIPMPCSTVERE